MSALCKHNQSGFCKLGETNCPKKHVTEICSRNTCVDKACEKICKYYVQNGFCKFNKPCAYTHKESEFNVRLVKLEKEIGTLKYEIQKLIKVLQDMAKMVLEIS